MKNSLKCVFYEASVIKADSDMMMFQYKYNIILYELLALTTLYGILIWKLLIMWNITLKWIIGVLWIIETFRSEVFHCRPPKRNVMFLNRRWYISGNYPHFIGARVANSTCVFLNDQQEQAIIMSSLIHWSDPLTKSSTLHTFTHMNMRNLKYYSLFQRAIFYLIYWQH